MADLNSRPHSLLRYALALGLALAWLAAGCSVGAQTVIRFPIPVPGQPPQAEAARQVTLFGVLATPNTQGVDPKLATVEPQLRKLLPSHSFRLLGVQTKRLTVGQTLSIPLGDGFSTATTLLHPLDDNGKVQLRCAVMFNQATQLDTLVTTPPNQLFFCDKPLPNGQRILIGVGAR